MKLILSCGTDSHCGDNLGDLTPLNELLAIVDLIIDHQRVPSDIGDASIIENGDVIVDTVRYSEDVSEGEGAADICSRRHLVESAKSSLNAGEVSPSELQYASWIDSNH